MTVSVNPVRISTRSVSVGQKVFGFILASWWVTGRPTTGRVHVAFWKATIRSIQPPGRMIIQLPRIEWCKKVRISGLLRMMQNENHNVKSKHETLRRKTIAISWNRSHYSVKFRHHNEFPCYSKNTTEAHAGLTCHMMFLERTSGVDDTAGIHRGQTLDDCVPPLRDKRFRISSIVLAFVERTWQSRFKQQAEASGPVWILNDVANSDYESFDN